jgi:hypothetical protein
MVCTGGLEMNVSACEQNFIHSIMDKGTWMRKALTYCVCLGHPSVMIHLLESISVREKKNSRI